MRVLTRCLVVCAALLPGNSAGADVPVVYCTDRELRAKDTTTIPLETGIRDKPAFYLRESLPERVLFLRPEDLLGLLHGWDEKNRQEIKLTLDQMLADVPLKEDTDIFKYALRDARFGAAIEYLAAELLDSGKVAVDFHPLHMPGKEAVQPNDQFDPTSIKRVYWKTRGGEGRKYCDPKGYGVLSVVDTIID